MSNKYFVYCLYQDKEVVYIGSSTKLDMRVDSHRMDKNFDSVRYCELCDYETMISYEKYGIYTLKPMYNKTIISPDGAKYVDVVWKNYKDNLSPSIRSKTTFSATNDVVGIPLKLLSAKQFNFNGDVFTLTLTQKIIFWYLYCHFRDNIDLPAYGDIGLDLDLTSKTVCRVMKFLVKIGIVKVKHLRGNKCNLVHVEHLK